MSFGYCLNGVPLSQPILQPPPPPCENAALYTQFFLNSIQYRSYAKTEKGQAKARLNMQRKWGGTKG